MKKIIILLTILFMQLNLVFANEFDNNFEYVKSMKLSQKQLQKIEDIQKRYYAQIAKINADIILAKMQIAKSNPKTLQVNSINFMNSVEIQDMLEEAQKQRDEEILSCLGFIQKFKYRRFCKANS